MTQCPTCGTPMHFMIEYDQWYCPNCRQYDPRSDQQHSYRAPLPKWKVISVFLVSVIVVIIVILAFIGYMLIDNDDNNKNNDPKIEINYVDLELRKGDEGYLSEYAVEFNYMLKFDNLPEEITIEWIIKLIGNGNVLGTGGFNSTIEGYNGQTEGMCYVYFGDNIPIPDKYRVEIYIDNELMDAMEEDVVI